jgi:hypothetical protein
MDCRRVVYRFCNEDDDFDVEARLDGIRIGHARCFATGDRLLLADIRIDKEVPRKWPVLPGLLGLLVGTRCPWRPRGLGIGHHLLTRLLREADGKGMREIWGSVMPADMHAWPGLLAWYQRHGFVIMALDAECLPGAAKKIVRRK